MRRIFRRRQRDEEQILEGEIIEEDVSSEEAPPDEPVEKPRRRGLFRRRQQPRVETRAPQPLTALERVAPDIPTPEELIHEYTRRAAPETAEAPPRRRFKLPRFNLRRLIVWREVRPGLLFLAAGLVAGGIFWTLYNLGRVSEDWQKWWPAALLGFALVWSFISLLTRRAGALLAATTLAGISISLLLDTQGYVTWQETLIGVVLVTIGVGIIIRGFLLRQGAVA